MSSRANKTFLASLSSLGLAATATPALAQYSAYDDPSRHRHDGFYLNFGLGGGYLNSSIGYEPDPGGPDSSIAGAGMFSQGLIGGTPARGLVVGGGGMNAVISNAKLEVGGEELSSAPLALYSTGAFVNYYPDPRGGFHVLGFLGIAALDYSDWEVTDNALAWGFSAVVAAGYEWWVGKQWSLGLMGRMQFARVSVTVDEIPGVLPETDVIHSVLAPGAVVALTYH